MFKRGKNFVITPDLLQMQVDAAVLAFTKTMEQLEEVNEKAEEEAKLALGEAERLTEKAKQCEAIKNKNKQTINQLKNIFGEGAI